MGLDWLFGSKHGVLGTFLAIDVLLYVDRGLIPGAHEEFSEFMMKWRTVKEHPEVFFAVLQSMFIVGLAVSAPILCYLSARAKKPLAFVAFGLSLWWLSLVGCCVAGACKSLTLLFLSRLISGVGEGAFVGLIVPVLLDANEPRHRAVFLGIFYGLMPFGVALGFIASAWLAKISNDWSLSFMVLVISSFTPILAVVHFAWTCPAARGASPFAGFIERENAISHFDRELQQADRGESMICQKPSYSPAEELTMTSSEKVWTSSQGISPIWDLAKSTLFVPLLIGGAASAAVSASLSSFGTVFLLNLHVFRSEFGASASIGIVGAIAGTLGTVAGGFLVNVREVTVCEKDLALQGGYANPSPAGECSLTTPSVCEEAPSSISVSPTNDQSFHSVPVQGIGEYRLSEEESSDSARRRIQSVEVTCYKISRIAFVAAVLLTASPIFFIWLPRLAILSLVLGLLLLFVTQSGLNLSIMNCVETEYRSLALSIYTLGLHLLGDVPGPILVGFMKDRLAPHCHAGANDLACDSERNMILLTLLVFLSWSHCIWLGFDTTYRSAQQMTSADKGAIAVG